ncbi:MAG TPA: bifunctional riboflavin kinase/FAD synthetase [Deltaproteobacteria bacterium]|jgi:riboflavin kinase/FMN adenylyltransferase|nr:bifunctional riboflavin kinase/FAD synthetase [Deltaproteobacteria bacterium]
MQVFHGIQTVQRKLKNPAITIGNFDGVHKGHQALFQRVKQLAEELNGESVVVTFDPHPLEVLFPKKAPSFITSHRHKLDLIASCGIDATIIIPFDHEFSRMSAREFVEAVLVEKIGARAIVVGHDYRFGHSREGDIAFLKKLGEQYGFKVQIVTGLRVNDTVVSSTAIRQMIVSGNIKEANRLLGRFFEVSGTVIPGRKRGVSLGFPTANIRMPAITSPRTGVYVVQAEVDGKTYGGAANLGYNPTFGDTDLSLEAHLFDFDQDIYGKPITVRFIDRLRNELRFSSPAELAAQIRKDVDTAKKILAGQASR